MITVELVLINREIGEHIICKECKFWCTCSGKPDLLVVCPVVSCLMIGSLYGIDPSDPRIRSKIENASTGILKRVLETSISTEMKAIILDEINKRGSYNETTKMTL